MAKRINKNSPVTIENTITLLAQEGYNPESAKALVEKMFAVVVKAHPEDNIREIAFYLKHM